MKRFSGRILMSIVISVLISVSVSIPVLAAEKDKDKEADKGVTPTYRFSGDAQLSSQFVDRGLAITSGNPGLSASFLFNMGQQFRIGFWGTNISNISAADDNLWLKIVADIHINFSNDSVFKLYFNDDHFYKSDIRNGQAFGINYDFKSYLTQVEWLSNFQGTKTDAVYLKFGKMFALLKEISTGASVGYTAQKSQAYYDYIDLKGFATYKLSDFFEFNAGVTLDINGSQFGSRGDPAIFGAIRLSY